MTWSHGALCVAGFWAMGCTADPIRDVSDDSELEVEALEVEEVGGEGSEVESEVGSEVGSEVAPEVGSEVASDVAPEVASDVAPLDTAPVDTAPPCPDRDGDHHADLACGGDDCDDGDGLVHPGADEVCNDVDDDCDDSTDEDLATLTCFADGDDDGHAPLGASAVTTCQTTCPQGYAPAGPDDCDDHNAAIFATLVGYRDGDGDGACASPTLVTRCTDGSRPADVVDTCPRGTSDCDDQNGGLFATLAGYRDADGDGHCAFGPSTFCTGGAFPEGYRADCPGGLSDACDGVPGGWVNVTGYIDGDGDGACADPTLVSRCTDGSRPANVVESCPRGTSDCNDNLNTGWVQMSCYRDDDSDGWCQSGAVQGQCGDGVQCTGGWMIGCRPTDCNDHNPYATDVCSYSETGATQRHCCGAFCPQKDPLIITQTFCGDGFHIASCVAQRAGGGGGISEEVADEHHCMLIQTCAFLEGSSAFLVVNCVAPNL